MAHLRNPGTVAPELGAVQPASVDKAFANLLARAALAGQTLERVDPQDGGPPFFRVGRWGLSRSLPDLQSVADFLDRVGAPR